MKKAQEYFNTVSDLLKKTAQTQMDTIDKAASMIADTMQKNGWLYIFGTGHSHMLAEEIFYRAGGMVRVKPILETGLMLHESASKSTELERLSGYADILLDEYGLKEGDTMIIISNSGRNSLCVEMASHAKARGVKTIALTSLTHSSQCTSRDKSGKRLFELADLVLDNGGCYGDACVAFGNRMAAPSSTVVGAAILNALECAIIEEMENRNQPIELYSSSNIEGGSEINDQFIKKYKGEIKSL
jgi:uncharacterized phosphosugar-binding protein